MALKFAFMLKTYSGDINYVNRLVESFHRYNVDSIPLFLVCPLKDFDLFKPLISKNMNLIHEEKIPAKVLQHNSTDRDSGYRNQMIYKLAFHRLGLVENYLCLDSDGIFLKEFSYTDFIHPDGNPYTVLVEDKELQSDLIYYKNTWTGRQIELEKIKKYLSIPNEIPLKTCHGFQTLSKNVLNRFEIDYLHPGNIDFNDLFDISGYEFTWYNYYLQKLGESIHETEPFFRCIHTGEEFAQLLLLGKERNDFAISYIGLVVNGNFQHLQKPANLEEYKVLNIAIYTNLVFLMRIISLAIPALILKLFLLPIRSMRRILKRFIP